MPTLEEAKAAKVAAGGDPKAWAESFQSKYGVHPDELAGDTDYAIIQKLGPNLRTMVDANKAVQEPIARATRKGHGWSAEAYPEDFVGPVQRPMAYAPLNRPKPPKAAPLPTNDQGAVPLAGGANTTVDGQIVDEIDQAKQAAAKKVSGGTVWRGGIFHPIEHAKRLVDIAEGLIEFSQQDNAGKVRVANKLSKDYGYIPGVNAALDKEVEDRATQLFHEQMAASHKEYEETPAWLAAAHNVQNVLSGIGHLTAKAVMPEPVPSTSNDVRGEAYSEQANKQFGSDFVPGAVAGVASNLYGLATHPIETLTTRPLETGLLLYPFAESGLNAARASKATRAARTLSPEFPVEPTEIIPAEWQTSAHGELRKIPPPEMDFVRDGEIVHPQVPAPNPTLAERWASVPGTIKAKLAPVLNAMNKVGDPLANSRLYQIVTDSLSNKDPRATALLEEIYRDPVQAANAVMAYKGRLSKAVEETAPIPTEPWKVTAEEPLSIADTRKVESMFKKGELDRLPPKHPDRETAVSPVETVEVPLKVDTATGSAEQLAKAVREPVEDLGWKSVKDNLEQHPNLNSAVNTVRSGLTAIASKYFKTPEMGQKISDAITYRLASILRDESPALLKDGGFRKSVVDKMVETQKQSLVDAGDRATLEATNWKALRSSLDDAFKQIANEPTKVFGPNKFELIPDTISGELGNFKNFDTLAALDAVARTMKPEAMSKIRARVAEQAVEQVAEEAVGAAQKAGLEAERMRAVQGWPESGAQTPATLQQSFRQWANKWGQYIAEGGMEPNVFPESVKVETPMADLGADLGGAAKADAQSIPVPAGQWAASLREWAATQTDPVTRLRVNAAADRIAKYQPLDEGLTQVGGLAAPRFKSAIEWELKSREGIKNFMGEINAQLSANQVGRSPTAIINNTLSNAAALAVKYGVIPTPDFFIRLGQGANRYKAWLDGDLKLSVNDPAGFMDGRFYQAYRKFASGTDRISSMEKPKLPLPGIDTMNDFVSETYKRYGDDMFKLFAARKQWDKLNTYIDRLEPGDAMTLPQSGGRKNLAIVKNDTGGFDVYGSRAIESAPINVTRTGLDSFVGKAAVDPAMRTFLNYTEGGIYKKALRQPNMPIIPVLSQYYSWFYGAMDVPFLKRGIGSSVLSNDGIVSTNKGIMASETADAVQTGLRRALVVNGLKTDLMSHDNNEVSRAFKFAPNDLKVGVATALSDPGTASYLSFDQSNFLEPTMKVLNLIGTAVTHMATETDPTKIDPKNKALAKKMAKFYTGEGQANASDLLDVVGAAGSTLLPIYTYFKDSERAGNVVTEADLWDKFGSLFLGPVPAKTIAAGSAFAMEGGKAYPTPSDTAAQAIAKAPASPYIKDIKKDPYANFLSTLIRQFTGLGWTTRVVQEAAKDEDRFFGGLEKEALKSFGVTQAEQMVEGLERNVPGGVKIAKPIGKDIDKYEAVIRNTVGDMRKDFDSVMDRLYKQTH